MTLTPLPFNPFRLVIQFLLLIGCMRRLRIQSKAKEQQVQALLELAMAEGALTALDCRDASDMAELRAHCGRMKSDALQSLSAFPFPAPPVKRRVRNRPVDKKNKEAGRRYREALRQGANTKQARNAIREYLKGWVNEERKKGRFGFAGWKFEQLVKKTADRVCMNITREAEDAAGVLYRRARQRQRIRRKNARSEDDPWCAVLKDPLWQTDPVFRSVNIHTDGFRRRSIGKSLKKKNI